MVLTQCKSDFLAFLAIVLLAKRLSATGIKIRSLVETIAVDAVWYFLVIFTSHFVLAMTLYFGRVSATTSLSGRWPMGAVAGIDKASSSSVSYRGSIQHAIILTRFLSHCNKWKCGVCATYYIWLMLSHRRN